jgi:hypothetical protein
MDSRQGKYKERVCPIYINMCLKRVCLIVCLFAWLIDWLIDWLSLIKEAKGPTQPRGSARRGGCVARPLHKCKREPLHAPKIRIITKSPVGTCQWLSWQEQILHLILAKRPRRYEAGECLAPLLLPLLALVCIVGCLANEWSRSIDDDLLGGACGVCMARPMCEHSPAWWWCYRVLVPVAVLLAHRVSQAQQHWQYEHEAMIYRGGARKARARIMSECS